MNKNKKLILISLILVVIAASSLAYFFNKKSKVIAENRTTGKAQVNTSLPEDLPSDVQLPKSLDDYEASLLDFKKNGTPTLESIYTLGESAKWELDEVINSLGENDLKIAEKKMQGYTLNPNYETSTIWPNPDTFLSLAKSHGKAEDVDFFTIKKAISSDGNWPNYISQLTDLTGCTAYNGTLTSVYKSLIAYKNNYSTSYVKFIEGELKAIETELTEENCACDSKEKVLLEMENFSKINSDSRIIDQLAKRIEAIKLDKADMTYNCGS